MAKRYSLSREEIGILMSFARRPEAMTEVWTRKLSDGVTEVELRELFQAAGLPKSSADDIISGDENTSTFGPAPLGKRFRRVIIGIVAVLTLANVVTAIAGGVTARTIGIALAFIASGILVVKLVDRLAPGPR